MAENKDLKLAPVEHELDENENPSSLNLSSSFKTVNNDSFNLISCESEKMYGSESQNLLDDALVDRGYHSENLDKVLPDLVSNSLTESVNVDLANSINEAKHASFNTAVSFCSVNDKSFDSIKDASFNNLENTTNSIELLFERLTLDSDKNVSHNLESSLNLESSAFLDNHIPSAALNTKEMPFEVSHDESFDHSNPLNVTVNYSRSINFSLPSDKILQETSAVPESNIPDIESKVPIDETFTAANPGDVSISTDVETLKCKTLDISDSDCPFSSETSLNTTFKHPLPVPASSKVSNSQNDVKNNDLSVNPDDDNLEVEEFQDAVQFFKDPSSFQILENIKTSDLASTNMPRDSLYMNFDPLYKRVVQLGNTVSAGMEEKDNGDFNKVSIKEETCDVNNYENKHVSSVPRVSLGDKLVSFDSPLKLDPNKVYEKEEIYSIDKKQYAPLRESISGNLLSFDSPMKSNTVKTGDLVKDSVIEEIDSVNNIEKNQIVNKSFSNVPVQETAGDSFVPFDSSLKCSSTENSDKKNVCVKKELVTEEVDSADSLKEDQQVINKSASIVPFRDSLYTPVKYESEKICGSLNKESAEKDMCIAENNQQLINKHISDIPLRESLSGNLLSFDSPIKSNSARNSVNMKASLLKNDEKIYTEDEFQQALKICELTMQEAYLKKQKELEEDASKKGRETAQKLHDVTQICKVLLEMVSELEVITSDQNTKNADLSARIKNLESEKEKLDSDLKTSIQELQSVENTFSDFHKRYVQSKDMLKTYKENEDKFKMQAEKMNDELEKQKQMYSLLQAEMGETVDKANAEVATAKKGGDAQIAVLKAQLKKSELKVSSLESDLKQVRIENDKLSSICDDLMAKVSEA